MKTTAFALAVIFTLAGCGIDGPPSKPAPPSSSGTTITISGEASIGVVGSL